jgi:hypothetical protein
VRCSAIAENGGTKGRPRYTDCYAAIPIAAALSSAREGRAKCVETWRLADGPPTMMESRRNRWDGASGGSVKGSVGTRVWLMRLRRCQVQTERVSGVGRAERLHHHHTTCAICSRTGTHIECYTTSSKWHCRSIIASPALTVAGACRYSVTAFPRCMTRPGHPLDLRRTAASGCEHGSESMLDARISPRFGFIDMHFAFASDISPFMQLLLLTG